MNDSQSNARARTALPVRTARRESELPRARGRFASSPPHEGPLATARARSLHETFDWVRAERDDLRAFRDRERSEHSAELREHGAVVKELEGHLAAAGEELEHRAQLLQRQTEHHQARFAAASAEIERQKSLLAQRDAEAADLVADLQRCRAHISQLEHILASVRGHRLFKWMRRLRLAPPTPASQRARPEACRAPTASQPDPS